MSLSQNYLELLNPHQLDVIEHSGAGFLAGAFASLLLNVETTLFDFTNGDRPLILKHLVFANNFSGSATGILYIRSNGELLADYFKEFNWDSGEVQMASDLEARIGPRARCVISFLNQTDGGVSRNTEALLSGYYEEILP